MTDNDEFSPSKTVMFLYFGVTRVADTGGLLRNAMSHDLIENLRNGQRTVWVNCEPRARPAFDRATAARHISGAAEVWKRFAPVLASMFETPGGTGRIESPLLKYPVPLVPGSPVYVKADHALPITATVKARGGVFALLRVIELIAEQSGLLTDGRSRETLTAPHARQILATHTIVVASTGNLGYSIGLVATSFGLKAEVHMSDCAQAWKKERLTRLGVTVVEHPGDYTSTVAAARASSNGRDNAWFIDDEDSWDLFLGYSGAGWELATQLDRAGVHVCSERPLIVYLPCGVGGAPGGITYGLRTIYGPDVICVFVEPIEAACMMVALAANEPVPRPVYDVGLSSRTEADGLAVARASALVLEHVGAEIDAAVAVPDNDLLAWVRRAWIEAGLKLEPSATAGFAALSPFLDQIAAGTPSRHMRPAWYNTANATHVVWTTGGNLVPEEIYRRFLCSP